jgi:hypothetical protein
MLAVKMGRLSAVGGLLLTGSVLMTAAPAAAQILLSPDEIALARTGLFQRDPNVSVAYRPRPDYAPLGLDLGSFKLAPELDTSLEYNDNIYAVPTAQTADEIFHISPILTATSDWTRNQVQLFARGSFNEYVNHSSEDTQNYAVGTTGRLDVYDDFGVAAGASFEHDTESRTNPNSPVEAIHPIQYDLSQAFLVGAYEAVRVRLSARFDYQDYNYQNGQLPGGGTLYQMDRDYAIESGTFRAEYAASPGASVFANLVINHQENYNLLLTDSSRTNSGYEATVGSNFDITHLIRGEVFIGYLDQTFEDHVYKEVSGVSLRGYVQYFPTQLVTLTFSGTRVPVDSVLYGAGAYLDSNVSVRADYELLRNLLISGTVTYENDDYSGISRQDNRNYESLGATYLMNRRVGLTLTYQHQQNDSSGVFYGNSFNINSLTAGLTLRY